MYCNRISRRFFISQDGHFGLGPVNTMTGDLIVVLRGCTIPVLLRKVGSYYVHVGACFVLGLMDGEAVEWVRAGKAHIQGFEAH